MTADDAPAATAPFARNLPALVRGLRDAGVRVGTGSSLVAAQALACVDLAEREDVRSALCAALVCDAADLAVFDSLFDVMFPRVLAVPAASQPALPRTAPAVPAPGSRRLAEALSTAGHVKSARRPDVAERDASGTASDHEVLAHKDFEQMSGRELAQARELLRAAPARAAMRRTRRLVPALRGTRLDLRRMLRDSLHGQDLVRPRRRAPVWRPRDWVLLCDVSGSMSTYSRMFLHLAHALARRAGNVETFAFATRLTRISRALQPIDPDAAMLAASRAVSDWEGGTRIGECLAEFNLRWARRVLARGAWVLLLTDGLERGAPELLEAEVTRLARSCRELVWINPLRRSAAYQPLAAGAAVLARHATRQKSAHNVASLLELTRLIESEREWVAEGPRAGQNS